MIKLRQSLTVRRLASERGQSLVLALIVLLVLTISAGAVAQLMTSNQNLSNNERQGVQAFTGGEAGLSVAADAVVANDAGNTQSVGAVLTNTTNVAGYTVVWKATKTATSQWTVGSVTKSPNGQVTRVLQQQMQSITIPGVPATIWGYGIVMGGASAPVSNGGAICSTSPQPSTTTRFTGSATITVPTWITTDVCIVGGANPAMGNPPSCPPPTVAPCPIAVHIGGALAVSGPDYAMGIPTNKVASASINNGCWANPHAGWTLLGGCDLNQGLNANSSPTAGSGVQAADYHPVDPSPTPVKPTLDSAKDTQLWSDASPGPNHPCTTGSAPANFFDNNAGSTSAPDSSLEPGRSSEGAHDAPRRDCVRLRDLDRRDQVDSRRKWNHRGPCM